MKTKMKLTQRQHDVLTAFEELTKQYGGPPSAREVGELVKPSMERANTWKMFGVLAKKGVLVRKEGRAIGGYRLP